MDILYFDLKQDAGGHARLNIVVNNPPSDLTEAYCAIQSGKPYSITLAPKKKKKSDDQREAIWAKINEIANILEASKEEIYEECLRRYGQGKYMRILKDDLKDVGRDYRIVDIKKDHNDGSVTVLAYRGLSSMDSREASYLLDGVLSECREMGLSGDIG